MVRKEHSASDEEKKHVQDFIEVDGNQSSTEPQKKTSRESQTEPSTNPQARDSTEPQTEASTEKRGYKEVDWEFTAMDYLQRGIEHMKEHRYRDAGDYFKRGSELDPKNKDLWNWLGSALFRRGRFLESLMVYEKSCDYSNPFFRFLLGEWFLRYNQLDEAELLLCSVLNDEFQQKDQLYLKLGQLYNNKKEFEKSIYYLKKAISYPEVRSEAFKIMGESYQSLGHWEEAISAYNSAHEIELCNLAILELLRMALFRNHEFERLILRPLQGVGNERQPPEFLLPEIQSFEDFYDDDEQYYGQEDLSTDASSESEEEDPDEETRELFRASLSAILDSLEEYFEDRKKEA